MNYYNPMQVGVQPNVNPADIYQQQQARLQQMQMQQFQQPQMQPQMQQGFSITPVSSIDEVKAKTVDWSGRPNYFIDNANGKIYSKYLDVTGIPKVDIYSLENESTNKIEYATKEELNNLKGIIDELLKNLGGTANE